MDDIMLLMNKIIIDIHGGFDDTQFGIFDEDEQMALKHIWENDVKRDAMRFINLLSPAQKERVAEWVASRTSYKIEDLIVALKRFCKYLEKLNSSQHVMYPVQQQKQKKGMFGLRKKEKKSEIV